MFLTLGVAVRIGIKQTRHIRFGAYAPDLWGVAGNPRMFHNKYTTKEDANYEKMFIDPVSAGNGVFYAACCGAGGGLYRCELTLG